MMKLLFKRRQSVKYHEIIAEMQRQRFLSESFSDKGPSTVEGLYLKKLSAVEVHSELFLLLE